jgi:hypothetical protein
VLDGLAGGLAAADEEGVGSGGGAEGKLIKGDDLATGLEDAGAGGLGDAEGADGELGDGEEALVIGDGTDGDEDLALGTLGEASKAGEGKGGAVDARHEETAEDDLVELGLGTAGEEAVKLHEEAKVHILGAGGGTATVLDVVLLDVDTLGGSDGDGLVLARDGAR